MSLSDPNIDEITQFSTSKSRPNVSYSSKQLIAHEIDTEKMRRLEFQKTGGNASKSTKKMQKEKTGKELPSYNHLQRLKPKALKNNEIVSETVFILFVFMCFLKSRRLS